MLREEDAVVGLLQGAPVMLLTAQVPCRDREEVLLCLLIRIVLGLQGEESSGHWLLPRTHTTKGGSRFPAK